MRALAIVILATAAVVTPDNLPVSFYVYLKETHPLYRFAPDHPCGKILQLRADKLPIGVAGLEFDDAREVSAKGTTLRRWRLPADASPLGVEGDRLIVDIGPPNGVVYVTSSGQIGITEDGPDQKLAGTYNQHAVECPASAEKDQLFCSSFTDGVTKQARVIAYSPPCT